MLKKEDSYKPFYKPFKKQPKWLVLYYDLPICERTADIYIVVDCGFLDILEPYHSVMADRGFKIQSSLVFGGFYLGIPPSEAKGYQMTSNIFVEKTFAKIKLFRILRTQFRLLEIPLLDDIMICFCKLVNLLSPSTGE